MSTRYAGWVFVGTTSCRIRQQASPYSPARKLKPEINKRIIGVRHEETEACRKTCERKEN